jgi:hypothetical protein
MLPFVSLLSQVGSNASSAAILGGAEVISNNVSQAWDRTWDIALSGGLYGAINNIGIFSRLERSCSGCWTLSVSGFQTK